MFPFVGAKPTHSSTCFFADSAHTMVAGGFCKSLGLWRVYDPAECTGAFHTPLGMYDALGLVKICRGGK